MSDGPDDVRGEVHSAQQRRRAFKVEINAVNAVLYKNMDSFTKFGVEVSHVEQ
jgi:hypothetical protein